MTKIELDDALKIFKEYIMEYKDYIVGVQETQEMWSNTSMDYIKRLKQLANQSQSKSVETGEEGATQHSGLRELRTDTNIPVCKHCEKEKYKHYITADGFWCKYPASCKTKNTKFEPLTQGEKT